MKNLFFLLVLLTLCGWATAVGAQDVDCAEQCLCCECEDDDVECFGDCDCAVDCECADLVEVNSNQSLQEEEYFEEPRSIVYVSYWPSAFIGAYIIFGAHPYYWYGGYYHRYHYYFYHGHRYWIHHHYWRHHRPSHGHPHPAHWSGGHEQGKAHGKGHAGYHGNKAPHKQMPSHKGQAPSYGKKKGVNPKAQATKFKKQAPSYGKKKGTSPKGQAPSGKKMYNKPVQKNYKSQGSTPAKPTYHAASYKQKAASPRGVHRASGHGGGSKPAYRSSSRSGGSRPANRSGRGGGRGRGRR